MATEIADTAAEVAVLIGVETTARTAAVTAVLKPPSTVHTGTITAAAGVTNVISAAGMDGVVNLPATTSVPQTFQIKRDDQQPVANRAFYVFVNAAGSDVFDHSGGSTQLKIRGQGQVRNLYGVNGIWTVIGGDSPDSYLRRTYAGPSPVPSAAPLLAMDALTARWVQDLQTFLAFLKTNGLKGSITEFGSPYTSINSSTGGGTNYGNRGDVGYWQSAEKTYLSNVFAGGNPDCWAVRWQLGNPFDPSSAYLPDSVIDTNRFGPCLNPSGGNSAIEAHRQAPSFLGDTVGPIGLTISRGYTRGGSITGTTEGTNNPNTTSNITEQARFGFYSLLGAGATITTPGTSANPYEYNYGYQEEFEMLAARLGPGAVIGIGFLMERLCRTDGSACDATEVARLKQAIGWANANGLKVMLRAMNNGVRYVGATGVCQLLGGANWTYAIFQAQWTAIATAFAGTPGLAAYEFQGEGGTAGAGAVYAGSSGWRACQQAIITAIRSSGGPNDQTTCMVVSASGNSSPVGGYLGSTYGTDTLFTDPASTPNIRYTAHHYPDVQGVGRWQDSYSSANSQFGYGFSYAGSTLKGTPSGEQDYGTAELINSGGTLLNLTCDGALHVLPVPLNGFNVFNSQGRDVWVEIDLSISLTGTGYIGVEIVEVSNGVDPVLLTPAWSGPPGAFVGCTHAINVGRVGPTARTFQIAYLSSASSGQTATLLCRTSTSNTGGRAVARAWTR
jgi:hypothetical protein